MFTEADPFLSDLDALHKSAPAKSQRVVDVIAPCGTVRRYGTPVEPRKLKSGRGDWIRTSDPLRPRQVRYQAALRPDSRSP